MEQLLIAIKALSEVDRKKFAFSITETLVNNIPELEKHRIAIELVLARK